MNTRRPMTPAEEKALEASWENNREAHDLLALINAEFSTDPQSVKCFDLRVVSRVSRCVALHAAHKKAGVVL